MMWFIDTDLDAVNGYGDGTKTSPRNQTVPLAESQPQVIDPTNPRGAFDDRIEHRLHVRWRSADNAEHFGSRRLMLQGLAQFCVALLDLFEQPHVFDGNYRLGRKGFEQLDLLLREGSHFQSAYQNNPDGNALAQKRGAEDGARASALLEELGVRKLTI